MVIYPTGDAFVLREQTIITVFDAIKADSAKLVTYRQNTQSENLSDVFKHLKEQKAEHQAALVELLRQNKLATRFAVTKKVPTRLKEYPDS